MDKHKRPTSFALAGRAVWTPRRYDQLAEEGYRSNVIVYRCVNLIARGIASVPWVLYKNDHEISPHPLLNLLNNPSPFQAGSAFMEAVVSYLLLAGNAYIELIEDTENTPLELYPLRPDRVKIIPGPAGVAAAYDYSVEGKNRRIFMDEANPSLLHLKNFHPLNDWYGMSPIEAAASAIDQHNTVAGHNLSLLQNGGRPSGALTLKPGAYPLTEEQRTGLREDLREAYEGAMNAGKVLVLEGEFDWREMGLSPKDLDFIEGKNLSAREIAQAYGVPPMLVGVPGDATFANYKEARYHLWEDTILPLLEHITAEFNLWLVPRFGKGLCLKYDSDAIPALASRRENTWAKIAAAPFLTVNEKREAVGYAPLTDGYGLQTNDQGRF